MKTHTGKLVNFLEKEREVVCTSTTDGIFDNGYFTMRLMNLHENVEGKDLVYDVMLKELTKYKQHLKDGKEVTVNVEWDIKDDYSEYIACRVLSVEVKDME